MNYLIYKSINANEFEHLHARIENIKSKFVDFLSHYGFKLSDETRYNEVLGIDMVSNNDSFWGNIGFLFDDSSVSRTFTFYLTKSKDVGKKRIFKRLVLADKVELDYIESNLQDLLDKSISVYSDIGESDLDEFITLKSN